MDVKKLIEQKKVQTLLQLVVSHNKDFAAGVEALSRGLDPDTGEDVSPFLLLREAEQQGLSIELEKLLVEKALQAFLPYYKKDPKMLVFVNIGAGFLDYAMETNFIIKTSKKLNIPESNIVLEIIPSHCHDIERSKKFVDYHRKQGFYISLDDIGKRFNNIDQILYIQPDIIKVNIIHLRKIKHTNYLINLLDLLNEVTSKLGIVAVAKGIESEEDVKLSLKYGAQFMQGYFVSKPQALKEMNLEQVIEYVHDHFGQYDVEEKLEATSRNVSNEVIKQTNFIKKRINEHSVDTIENEIEGIFEEFNCVENIWFVNRKGIQYMDAFINYDEYPIKKSPVFQIYNAGSDFSTKTLFRQLEDTILTIWVTNPYKSILSNNMCVTVTTYSQFDNKDLVLCVNYNYERIIKKIQRI